VVECAPTVEPAPTTAPQPVQVDAGTDCGTVVETHLKGVSGLVVTLCTTCDQECGVWGPPCELYGACCGKDQSGNCNAVCAACCDGAQGELRCRQHE
jgi:hypothetical protein